VVVATATTDVAGVVSVSPRGQRAQTPIAKPTTITPATSRPITLFENLRHFERCMKGSGFTPEKDRYPQPLEVRMAKSESERHPFRFLVKFLIFVGILFAASKLLAKKKDEYMGMTESEARSKFETKLGPRIGEDKAAEMADQVIPKLKEAGVIKDDPEDEVVDLADSAEEVLEEVSD